MKKLFLMLLCMALVASFALAKDGIDPVQKRAEMQAKIDVLRAEGQAKGWTFTLGVNPAMQYTIPQLCNFKPELQPYNSGDDHLRYVRKGGPWAPTPTPTDTPTGDSYMGYWTAVRNQVIGRF